VRKERIGKELDREVQAKQHDCRAKAPGPIWRAF
jgi:hypothetical protein